ncbi:MAG: hypothetical protein JWN00_4977 [Actinomycetia bacterium]|nr:hypothetical protein [Actinomycetes bacterium]
MEPGAEEVISNELGGLADQAGPFRFEGDDLVGRVRRRRRVRAGGAVLLCTGLTAAAVGAGLLLPHGSPAQSVGVAAHATTHQPKYCGAPRLKASIPIDLSQSGPPGQEVLDQAAQQIDQISGAGHDVTYGWAKGRFSRSFTQVGISNEWHEVIVYRLPDAELDAAICKAVRNVTVELNDSVMSALQQARLRDRIMKEVSQKVAAAHGFQMFSWSLDMDGRVEISTDHPDAARKVLAKYGPYIKITKGTAAVPLGATTTGK